MLTDAQIERYGRQIILPEVGGRGQERLLAARVAVAGDGPAAETAVTLLARAGVGMLEVSDDIGPLPELSPDCRVCRLPRSSEGPMADVLVRLLDGLEDAKRPVVLGMGGSDGIYVLTLVGQPCMACHAAALGPGGLEDDGAASTLHPAPARLALGALAANEALRVLLSPPAHGRLTRLSFKDGVGTARDLATAGCSYCNSPP